MRNLLGCSLSRACELESSLQLWGWGRHHIILFATMATAHLKVVLWQLQNPKYTAGGQYRANGCFSGRGRMNVITTFVSPYKALWALKTMWIGPCFSLASSLSKLSHRLRIKSTFLLLMANQVLPDPTPAFSSTSPRNFFPTHSPPSFHRTSLPPVTPFYSFFSSEYVNLLFPLPGTLCLQLHGLDSSFFRSQLKYHLPKEIFPDQLNPKLWGRYDTPRTLRNTV